MKKGRIIGIVVVSGVLMFLLHTCALIVNTPQWLPQAAKRHFSRAGRGQYIEKLIESPQLRVTDVHNFGGSFGGGYCSAQCEIIGTNSPLVAIRQACAAAGWVDQTELVGQEVLNWHRHIYNASGEWLFGSTNDMVFLPNGITNIVWGTHPILVVRYPYAGHHVLFYLNMWH